MGTGEIIDRGENCCIIVWLMSLIMELDWIERGGKLKWKRKNLPNYFISWLLLSTIKSAK